MPDATATALTVELYRVQGGVAAPLQVRCAGETPDATDIEALIAAAIAAHNSDPAAHPDLRKAIEDAAGSGGTLVTTPVLTLAERLPIGAAATLGMTARAGLNGAHVARFEVTVGDAAPVDVSAADDAATYAFTPAGNAGDTLTVGVVAVDNYGNRSPEATATAILYEPGIIVVGIDRNAPKLHISRDSGLTYESATMPYTPIHVDDDGTVLGVDDAAASKPNVYRGGDWGAAWDSSPVFTLASAFKGCVKAGNGTLFLCDSSILYASDDRGLTWREYKTGFKTIKGMLSGPNGALCLYGDGFWADVSIDDGATWKSVILSGGSTVRAIHLGGKPGLDGGDVLVVSAAYGAMRYITGTAKKETLAENTTLERTTTQHIVVRPDGSACACVYNAGSNNWSYMELATPAATYWTSTTVADWIERYIYASGIMFDANGRKSTDDGVTFTKPVSSGYLSFSAIYAFPDLA